MTGLATQIAVEVEGNTGPEARALAGDRMAVRDLLARIATIEEEEQTLTDTLRAIQERYAEKFATLAGQKTRFRESVRNFLLHHNDGEKIVFPDVGTAYLRTVKPKLDVTDADAFERAAVDVLGRGGLYVEKFDTTAARKAALERAVSDGIVFEGATVVGESKDLSVRLS